MYEQRRWLLRNPILWFALPVAAIAIAMGSTDEDARWLMPIPAVVIGFLFASNLIARRDLLRAMTRN